MVYGLAFSRTFFVELERFVKCSENAQVSDDLSSNTGPIFIYIFPYDIGEMSFDCHLNVSFYFD